MTTTTITKQLRQAVINDYAKLVYEDHGTQPDEISLDDFIAKANAMTYDELVAESWFIEGDEECTIENYIECFADQDHYTDIAYQTNPDGSTTPLE